MEIWIVILAILAMKFETVSSEVRCGRCKCSNSLEEVYCTRRELRTVPTLPRIATQRIRIMALQDNNISSLR